MSKWLLGCFALLCVLLLLHAQDKAPAPEHVRSVPQRAEQTPADEPSVQILNSVTLEPQKEEKPKGYWARFFAPENLPNIILCVVGLVGIPVAVRTLIMLRRQTTAMQDTLDVSRRTLLLQFRPILTVRGLRAQGFLQDPKYPEKKEVFLAIENTGGSDAHIVSSQIVVKIVDYAAAMFSLMEGAISLDKKTLKPGEGHVKSIPIDNDLTNAMTAETAHHDDPHWEGHKLIYCVGNVDYLDDLNINRTLTLYRRFDPKTFEFTPINDSDSEYKPRAAGA